MCNTMEIGSLKMPLTRQDALRLLRFCLGPDDSGSIEVADDGAALVTIAPAEPSIGVRTFEASTFDAALRMAVDAGLLKAACVEKQILFLEGGAARGPDALSRGAPAPAAARPVPEVDRGDVGPAARNAERARHVRDRGGVVGPDLSPRAAAPARAHGRAAGAVPVAVARDGRHAGRVAARADSIGSMAACASSSPGAGRIDDGRTAPAEVIASYTRANAELLGIGDAALVAYASADNRPNALACVVLLYAKEKTGIERARIGAGLAAKAISDDDRRALAALTSARTSYLHVFAATAPRPAEQLLEQALASASYQELTQMEELLLAGRESEIDLDARGWFNAVTREMDHLGEIGTAALGFVDV